ncbi:DUF4167 domain-containing protein [Sphingomonas dokdonensis]|uniref:DUF4167 domain-containing protein n=1 Tax=Sphingomonas dokdonensis TaxID=344880 RepID=A0A245ZD33_9SPHN|nr:DUF4167 domain-containing protein [Sphingomonas dokdonensis]OWK27603.1 hypothetical protein SPDO_31910 [Sphingomonas dokdonensis]
MINNRQNGRRRGRGGGQRSQGGGGQGQRDNGNRIDSRARGNASQLYEKYKNMASDAQRQGDRVNTEYYLQFADHYFRVLADQRGRYEDQNRDRRPQNDFDSDDDYGDEGEPIRAEEQGRGGDERGEREGGRQHDGNRQYDGHRSAEARQQDGGRYRSDRDEGSRADNARADGGDGRQRDGQQRRQRTSAPRADQRRDDRMNAEAGSDAPLTVESPPADVPQSAPPALADAEAAAPKRRGRPRKTPVEGDEQLGLDASALPPSIGSDTAATEEAAPKPRRRRTIAAPAEADA